MVYNRTVEFPVALLGSAEDLESFGGPGRALQRLDNLRVGSSVLIPRVDPAFAGRR